MKKFKLYQFVLALAAAVLLPAAASAISTANAAPAASATHLQGVTQDNQIDAQWRRRRNRWVGPAIALGVFGAAAAAAANQGYYNNNGYYYDEPYGYYQPRRQRCFVQTDPAYNRGYWTWC